MIAASVFGILYRSGLLRTLVQVYLGIFGVTICVVETVDTKSLARPLAQFKAFVFKYFHFMFVLYGRALFYGFCTSLLLAQWPYAPDVLVGLWMSFVTFTYAVVGFVGSGKMKESGFPESEDGLEAAFREADVDRDDRLSPTEFEGLCKSLPMHMTLQEVEAQMLMVGTDTDGFITYDAYMKYFILASQPNRQVAHLTNFSR